MLRETTEVNFQLPACVFHQIELDLKKKKSKGCCEKFKKKKRCKKCPANT